MKRGDVAIIGMGRSALAYPDAAADILETGTMDPTKCCITCSACLQLLADGGAVVAVVGHSPVDDSALGAADLSVALGAAGSSAAEWSVQLASDDVRDSAYAVRLAHRTRGEARLGLLLALGPAAAAALAVAFTLLPPLVAPLVTLGGAALALARRQEESP